MKILSTLYGGQVRVEFSPGNHRYVVNDNDQQVEGVASVTTILGILDKPFLVRWAVNSALGVVAASAGGGIADLAVEAVLEAAKKAHSVIRQQALSVGTEVHQFLEDWFTLAERPLLPTAESESGRAILAAVKWFSAHEVRPLEVERRIYSRRRRYVGTLDLVAEIDGVKTLVDYKTSKDLYWEYHLQTAAYQAAWEEETGDRIEQRILLRLDKETGEPGERVLKSRRQLQRDLKAFAAAQLLHSGQRAFKEGYGKLQS